MKCLYIASEYPISPNAIGGGGVLVYEQLISLLDLGVQVDLWHFSTQKGRIIFNQIIKQEPQTWKLIEDKCSSIHFSELPDVIPFNKRLSGKFIKIISRNNIHNSSYFIYLVPFFHKLLEAKSPDFIWAQNFGSAEVATLQNRIPVVYSHHDWLYNLKTLAGNKIEWDEQKKQEESVAIKSKIVVSGSTIEGNQLQGLGCKNVYYLPITYPVSEDKIVEIPGNLRIVHVGSLSTTASRLGLESFIETILPKISPPVPEFWVVGNLNGASPDLLESIRNVAISTGFVTNLDTVLRPFDIHIIPWQYSTGQRTRFPLALKYGQVVLAVRSSVAGFPEAQDGINCILVDSLEQMVDKINEIANDIELRKRIGFEAQKTFTEHFTRAAVKPIFLKILDELSIPKKEVSQ